MRFGHVDLRFGGYRMRFGHARIGFGGANMRFGHARIGFGHANVRFGHFLGVECLGKGDFIRQERTSYPIPKEKIIQDTWFV